MIDGTWITRPRRSWLIEHKGCEPMVGVALRPEPGHYIVWGYAPAWRWLRYLGHVGD